MKIKLQDPVTDYENKPIRVPDKEGKEETLTYFSVFINSLNSQAQGEHLTAEMKNKIYQISKKIYMSNEPNFTPDQLVIIKDRVGKTYAPMVYGKIVEVIDGTDEAKAETKPADPKPSGNSAAN